MLFCCRVTDDPPARCMWRCFCFRYVPRRRARQRGENVLTPPSAPSPRRTDPLPDRSPRVLLRVGPRAGPVQRRRGDRRASLPPLSFQDKRMSPRRATARDAMMIHSRPSSDETRRRSRSSGFYSRETRRRLCRRRRVGAFFRLSPRLRRRRRERELHAYSCEGNAGTFPPAAANPCSYVTAALYSMASMSSPPPFP